MKKIMIIGNSGSGKSTLARKLSEKTGLPLYHIDMMYWTDKGVPVTRQWFLEKHNDVVGQEKWIIDGNFAGTMEIRMAACDTIIFLDYPTDVCLDGVRRRIGTKRPDIPWIETREDPVFMEYVSTYNEKVRPNVIEMIKKYQDKELIVLHSREEANLFIDTFCMIE